MDATRGAAGNAAANRCLRRSSADVANIHSVHSVGNSIVQYLDSVYPAELRALYPCSFQMIASNQLEGEVDFGTSLTLYLYRIVINEHLRNQVTTGQPTGSRPPLSVDLHFMVSVWADSAAAEQTISAWVMQQLNEHPMLDASSLTPEGGWATGDYVQIVPAELTNEDLMRIWDALEPHYRLSTSYIARTVRVDATPEPLDKPVVTTRFGYRQLTEADVPEPAGG